VDVTNGDVGDVGVLGGVPFKPPFGLICKPNHRQGYGPNGLGCIVRYGETFAQVSEPTPSLARERVLAIARLLGQRP
jgi:hypothetical protein